MNRIILITGGQRSGKSKKAEEIAMSLSDNPVYVATAHIWDEEFRERVKRHQERRGPQWTNIEEEKFLSRHDLTGRVAVIDGGRRLTGAPVHACDLRAGAAMVIAGMVASGVTEIDDIHFIERGYERFVEKLNALGADIRVHYDEEDALTARAFSAS